MTAIPQTDTDALSEELLAEARRPGAAEPVAIHVRPELHCRMKAAAVGTDPPLPVVVDEEIPAFPGYEIHRAAP
ncbi:hypothetical protein [Geodermatophilus marinus]|uniref:hypothetical protein n=1 Tax=Geodermatophilus sp. LHW52908 TaxID=2303986 RepID=UPI000E3B8E92|nr:hypothetical protein [Geodermatophilus sp. LHW52908]RFU22067.1 hypothetical protein D0Z06_08105 [Geodermatophilus sp. LHW52908]